MDSKEPLPGSKDKFAFGKNWEDFVNNNLSDNTLSLSVKSMANFLDSSVINKKSFLDVGCGSGIHSLSALKLGASHVVSTDVDMDSVKSTENVKNWSKTYDSVWSIKQGSILDKSFVDNLGQHDVVYCWGVAHHTGDMWKALENLTGLVKVGGVIFLAIYNNVEGKRGSKMWHKIKKTYNKSPLFFKKIMEWFYISWSFIMLLVRFNNPFYVISNYKKKRGMSWKTDLVDWLGGYPYEYASVSEIFDFYHKKGFYLEKIKTTNYIGCNQFLFIKK